MSALKTSKVPFIYTSTLYLFGLFLFLEWQYPVNKMTDDTNISVFVIYTLFCFAISLLQIRWYISFLLKGFGLFFIVHGLYFEASILTKLWFQEIYSELTLNMQALFAQHWYDLTNACRSVLFLLLIWLMSYLIFYWFISIKRILLFILLTFIYLAVLDTFTVYDAGAAIVRTFIFSFLALGMANFFKEMQRESIQFSWARKNYLWIIPIIFTVCFSTLIGYAAPKFGPQWPDPVPFIQNVTGNGSGVGIIQKVGYGEDDSRLGGSFVQDYTPVFQAAVKEAHYWRIETKDVYTGKGWEQSIEAQAKENIIETIGSIPLTTFYGVETEELEAILDFHQNTNIPKLLQPYGIKAAFAENAQFLTNVVSGAVRTQRNGVDISLDHYTVHYDHPSYEINALRETEDDGQVYLDFYTQLPADLPERVHELALEITEPFHNRYDMARAIEKYFSVSSHGFTYQTTNVPVPGAADDYVDQFLFDSKVGYCDNFSSSMVVLLRTLDIPARWVKGFTSGEMVESVGRFDIYEVTNANAHSWVEVYFPAVGWVPFEPTQGFSNLTDFHVNADADEYDDALEAPTPERDPKEPEAPQMPEDKEVSAAVDQQKAGGNQQFILTKWHAIIGGIFLLILAILIYKTRFKWQARILASKMKHKQDLETYQDAYHHVLKLLNHEGHTKAPNQTLREYAREIDVYYSMDTMGQLTGYYEQMIYNNNTKQMRMPETIQLWKNLIKHIIG